MAIHEGELLKEWVNKHYRNIAEFGKACGVYRNTVVYWMNCETLPTERRWMLKEMGVPIQAEEPILTGEGNMLKQYLRERGISNTDIAKKLNIDAQNITNMFNRAVISSRFKERFKQIGIDIFVTDKNANVSNVVALPDLDENKFTRSRIVHAQSYAGYLQGHNDNNYIMNLPEHIIYVDESGKYRTFEVKGDSMEPEFPSGCLVDAKSLDPVHWKKFHPGHIFVILHNEKGLLIKLVKSQHDDILTLRSINDYYEDFEISLKDCLEVWYFVQKHDTNRNYSKYLFR